ncbi:hypothetical protein KO527_24175 [Pseudoalteromonas sp. C2R02]|uniref:hypothetical protein n=1 Tax=Pseudoalteromonas sp. C2R02 TaxID=2841565 RepID=UPI001C095A5A|nr:hypothetical protein [Pseudoalteromonas sp. C2R02]MBU2972436.1 hypothetical protein [Pseudoalteromonas sp. C2R02]
MTSPSKENQNDKTAKALNQALDASVKNLSASVVADLEKARNTALMKSAVGSDKTSIFTLLNLIFNNMMFKVAAPIAAVILISLTTINQPKSIVPEIPLAMMSDQVPTEDLMLLEELEFITWLAENEQNALL